MSAKDIAKRVAGGSPVTAGREKIQVEDLIKDYPEGITLTGMDLFNGEDGDYAVFNFKEDDKLFFMGGKVLTDYAVELIKEYGSVEDASAELAADPVKIILRRTKTKRGKDCTVFDVVD